MFNVQFSIANVQVSGIKFKIKPGNLIILQVILIRIHNQLPVLNRSLTPILILFVVLPLTIISGCHSKKEKSIEAGNLPSDSAGYTPQVIPLKQVSDSIGEKDNTSDEDLDEHLFGKFYGDRAGFYIFDNPSNTILGHKVKSMTLFYLDGKLYKAKYIINDNLVNDLINMYPRFYIRGFDMKNREMLKDKMIYYRKNKKWYMNDSLSNYDIQWKVGGNEMQLRINENNPDRAYQYVVKSRDYDEALAVIQREE